MDETVQNSTSEHKTLYDSIVYAEYPVLAMHHCYWEPQSSYWTTGAAPK